MSSFIKNCLSPKRPQSIVHRFGRMSSSIAMPFGNKAEKKSTLKKNKKEKKDKKTRNSKSARKFHRNSDNTSSSVTVVTSETLKEINSACGSDEDFSERSAEESLIKSINVNDEEDFFVALDQNEFLMECFMTNECSDVTFIVHFFAEDSALSEHIEDLILIRTMEAGSNCQCRRVNSRRSPLFTAKLRIDPEQPTIVAIRNGKVVDRISDISSGCWELDRWLADTGILMSKPDRDVFPNMNIHSC